MHRDFFENHFSPFHQADDQFDAHFCPALAGSPIAMTIRGAKQPSIHVSKATPTFKQTLDSSRIRGS